MTPKELPLFGSAPKSEGGTARWEEPCLGPEGRTAKRGVGDLYNQPSLMRKFGEDAGGSEGTPGERTAMFEPTVQETPLKSEDFPEKATFSKGTAHNFEHGAP